MKILPNKRKPKVGDVLLWIGESDTEYKITKDLSGHLWEISWVNKDQHLQTIKYVKSHLEAGLEDKTVIFKAKN